MLKRVLLCILDGWGLGENDGSNAISIANTPNFDFLSTKYDFIKLMASENDVGLPNGQFGNSEVGHTNIGAGRIIMQDIMRISRSFDNDELRDNETIKKVKTNCKRIHLIGLVSDGGVHGHQKHLFDLIEILNQKDSEILFIVF